MQVRLRVRILHRELTPMAEDTQYRIECHQNARSSLGKSPGCVNVEHLSDLCQLRLHAVVFIKLRAAYSRTVQISPVDSSLPASALTLMFRSLEP